MQSEQFRKRLAEKRNKNKNSPGETLNLTTSNFINNYGAEKIDSPYSKQLSQTEGAKHNMMLRLNTCGPLHEDFNGGISPQQLQEQPEDDITLVISQQPHNQLQRRMTLPTKL